MSQNMPDRMLEKMSKDMLERMPERMSENMPNRYARKRPENMPHRTANSRSQCAPVEISSSSGFHQSCPFSFILARKKCQKNVPERRSEYMSEPWQTGMTVFL